MKILIKATGVIRDCASDVGYLLIDAQLAEEVKEFKPEPEPNLKFYVQPGARPEGLGGYEYPPLLRWSCSGCGIGQGCYTESWQGTAHETTVVRHCGLVEKCPPDVAAKYLAAFKKWRSNGNRAVLSSGTVSRHSGPCSPYVDPQDETKFWCGCTRKDAQGRLLPAKQGSPYEDQEAQKFAVRTI